VAYRGGRIAFEGGKKPKAITTVEIRDSCSLLREDPAVVEETKRWSANTGERALKLGSFLFLGSLGRVNWINAFMLTCFLRNILTFICIKD